MAVGKTSLWSKRVLVVVPYETLRGQVVGSQHCLFERSKEDASLTMLEIQIEKLID